MENKYYTPEIEEFHVGFRFLYQESDFAQWGWVKYKEGMLLEGMNVSKCIDTRPNSLDNNIKVKYLDQDDIEELGWSYLTKEMGARVLGMYYRKGDYFLLHDLYKSVQVIKLDDYSNLTDIFKHGIAVFVGEIKNYNELKTLMRQLNI